MHPARMPWRALMIGVMPRHGGNRRPDFAKHGRGSRDANEHRLGRAVWPQVSDGYDFVVGCHCRSVTPFGEAIDVAASGHHHCVRWLQLFSRRFDGVPDWFR